MNCLIRRLLSSASVIINAPSCDKFHHRCDFGNFRVVPTRSAITKWRARARPNDSNVHGNCKREPPRLGEGMRQRAASSCSALVGHPGLTHGGKLNQRSPQWPRACSVVSPLRLGGGG